MPALSATIGKGSVMALVPDVSGIAEGGTVVGRGIAPGTTVIAIRGANAVQLSQGATESLTGGVVFPDIPAPVAEPIVAAFAAFDPDGDGKPGGAVAKAKRKPKAAPKPEPKPVRTKPSKKRKA